MVKIQQVSTECLLMLMDIIHKGSMPNSSSTTYPTEASLSDILFLPSFESSRVLYISPTDTSYAKLDFRRLAIEIAKILFSM